MPASYPTSVKTWTALVDGADYPQADDLNTIYDEITAIEGGIRNGTAPLNSSASTVVSLSVSGGSTLATLSVAGGSSFSTGITIYAPTAKNHITFKDSSGTGPSIQGRAADGILYVRDSSAATVAAFHNTLILLDSTKVNLNTVATSTAATSGGGTLPGSPSGFFELYIGNNKKKVPYYEA